MDLCAYKPHCLHCGIFMGTLLMFVSLADLLTDLSQPLPPVVFEELEFLFVADECVSLCVLCVCATLCRVYGSTPVHMRVSDLLMLISHHNLVWMLPSSF